MKLKQITAELFSSLQQVNNEVNIPEDLKDAANLVNRLGRPHSTFMIIEEPEENLFPSTQYELIKHIFVAINRNKEKIKSHLFDELGIKIIKMEVSNGSGLMANHHTVDLDGDVMNEVYSHANDNNLIFFIDIGRPNNNCYQVENLKNAILKYPNMTFIICHLTAPQHEQMDILMDNMSKLNLPNVYFDIASLPNNTKQPYPFIEAQRYIKEAIKIALNEFQPIKKELFIKKENKKIWKFYYWMFISSDII